MQEPVAAVGSFESPGGMNAATALSVAFEMPALALSCRCHGAPVTVPGTLKGPLALCSNRAAEEQRKVAAQTAALLFTRGECVDTAQL
jgi:hypothetical protein